MCHHYHNSVLQGKMKGRATPTQVEENAVDHPLEVRQPVIRAPTGDRFWAGGDVEGALAREFAQLGHVIGVRSETASPSG